MVRVVVGVKGSYEEIAFRFPAMVSAGAFMECLAGAAEQDLVFTVTFETKEEPKSRFINPEEGAEE